MLHSFISVPRVGAEGVCEFMQKQTALTGTTPEGLFLQAQLLQEHTKPKSTNPATPDSHNSAAKPK